MCVCVCDLGTVFILVRTYLDPDGSAGVGVGVRDGDDADLLLLHRPVCHRRRHLPVRERVDRVRPETRTHKLISSA